MNNVQRHAYLLVNFIEKCPKHNCLLENDIQNKKKNEKKNYWCHNHIENSRNVNDIKFIECIYW